MDKFCKKRLPDRRKSGMEAFGLSRGTDKPSARQCELAIRPANDFWNAASKVEPDSKLQPTNTHDLPHDGSELMNNKRGSMMQKPRGAVLRTPREFSNQMQFGGRQKRTFGILERGRAIGAEVGRAKTWSRLNFEFCATRLLEQGAVQKSKHNPHPKRRLYTRG
jgi:hypothetical protein